MTKLSTNYVYKCVCHILHPLLSPQAPVVRNESDSFCVYTCERANLDEVRNEDTASVFIQLRPLYLRYMHVALVHQGRELAQHGLQCRRFDAGSVMCNQCGQTRQRGKLETPLVLP